MGFTIEVKKKAKDEEFSFEDLEMFHRECCGGKIKVEEYSFCGGGHRRNGEVFAYADRGIRLICLRCGLRKILDYKNEEAVAGLFKTAVDGQKRKLTEDITVVQKR